MIVVFPDHTHFFFGAFRCLVLSGDPTRFAELSGVSSPMR